MNCKFPALSAFRMSSSPVNILCDPRYTVSCFCDIDIYCEIQSLVTTPR